MTMIIVGAIVSLLIFFFEEWWKKNHPSQTNWAAAKGAFMERVNAKWRFKLVPRKKREAWAERLFDKFRAKYEDTPQPVSNGILNAAGAKALAQKVAEGLTLDPHEL